MNGGLSRSVHVRLIRHANAQGVDPNLVLARYATERLLYRLSRSPYGGQRITLLARLGPARLRVQVDIGVGDAVMPEPEMLEYPSLLDLPRPRLRAYRPETSIAEKVHAMVVLGSKNSRMRDFFDIHALAFHFSFDGTTLARAIRTTFERRRTEIPTKTPIALTPAFAAIEGKHAQWAGFRRRSRITAEPAELEVVVDGLASLVVPVFAALGRSARFAGTWPPGGPWGAVS